MQKRFLQIFLRILFGNFLLVNLIKLLKSLHPTANTYLDLPRRSIRCRPPYCWGRPGRRPQSSSCIPCCLHTTKTHDLQNPKKRKNKAITPVFWIRIRRIRTYVIGPPGSGPVSQRYGSGSGSFYHQAKIVRKTSFCFVTSFLGYFLSLKKVDNVPSKSNKQKNFLKS